MRDSSSVFILDRTFDFMSALTVNQSSKSTTIRRYTFWSQCPPWSWKILFLLYRTVEISHLQANACGHTWFSCCQQLHEQFLRSAYRLPPAATVSGSCLDLGFELAQELAKNMWEDVPPTQTKSNISWSETMNKSACRHGFHKKGIWFSTTVWKHIRECLRCSFFI